MKSIKTKLMLGTSALIIFTLIILGTVTVNVSKKALVSQTEETIQKEVDKISEIYGRVDHEITSIEGDMLTRYDELIKEEVNTSLSILESVYTKYESGLWSETEAKEIAKDLIKSLRYGDNSYLWIDDLSGNLVAHPIIPDKEGINRLGLQDPNGVKIIGEIISAATDTKNNGYTNFMWEKPEDVGTGNLTSKRAYSVLFEPWGWVVSTGNYLDTIYNEIENFRSMVKGNFQNDIEKMSVNKTIAILDPQGTFLYFSSPKVVGTTINVKDLNTGEDIGQKILSTEDDNLEYTIEDLITKKEVKKISYVKHDKERDIFIVTSTDSALVFAEVKNIINIFIILTGIAIILSLIVMYFLANAFTSLNSPTFRFITVILMRMGISLSWSA